jgi:hypothetical protein
MSYHTKPIILYEIFSVIASFLYNDIHKLGILAQTNKSINKIIITDEIYILNKEKYINYLNINKFIIYISKYVDYNIKYYKNYQIKNIKNKIKNNNNKYINLISTIIPSHIPILNYYIADLYDELEDPEERRDYTIRYCHDVSKIIYQILIKIYPQYIFTLDDYDFPRYFYRPNTTNKEVIDWILE